MAYSKVFTYDNAVAVSEQYCRWTSASSAPEVYECISLQVFPGRSVVGRVVRVRYHVGWSSIGAVYAGTAANAERMPLSDGCKLSPTAGRNNKHNQA